MKVWSQIEDFRGAKTLHVWQRGKRIEIATGMVIFGHKEADT